MSNNITCSEGPGKDYWVSLENISYQFSPFNLHWGRKWGVPIQLVNGDISKGQFEFDQESSK